MWNVQRHVFQFAQPIVGIDFLADWTEGWKVDLHSNPPNNSNHGSFISRVLTDPRQSWDLSHFPGLESPGIRPRSWKVVENDLRCPV